MKATKIKKAIVDILEMIFIGVAVFFLAWFLLAEPLEVTGNSMAPTLKDKEQILSEKVTVEFGEIERGDVVVFRSPQNNGMLLIKRVVALPGDKLVILDGKVFINGTSLSEPYVFEQQQTVGKKAIPDGQEVVLEDTEYIVLGDNRKNSNDSRDFGPIDKDLIQGVTLGVYFPFESLRFL